MASLRDLFSQALQYGGLTLLSRGLRLLLVPLFTYLLEPEDYGLLDLAGATSTLLTVAMLGIDYGMGFLYYDRDDPAYHREVLSTAFCSVLVLTLLATGGLYACGHLRLIPDQADMPLQALGLICLTVPLSALLTVLSKFFRVRLQVKRYGALAIFNMLASVGGNVAAIALLRWGVMGVFLVNIFTEALSLGFGLFLARDALAPIWRGRLAWRMLALGFPLIPHLFAFHAIQTIDRYALSFWHSREAVGYFGVAMKLGALLTAAMGAMGSAWGPWAYSIHKEQDAKLRYARGLRLITVLWTLTAGAVMLAGSAILHLGTDPAYAPSTRAVVPVVLAVYLSGLYQHFQISLSVAQRTWPLIPLGVIALAINLAWIAWRLPDGDFVEAAWSQVVCNAAVLALLYGAGRRIYPLPHSPVHLLACLTLTGACGAVTQVIDATWPLNATGLTWRALALLTLTGALWPLGADELILGIARALRRAGAVLRTWRTRGGVPWES